MKKIIIVSTYADKEFKVKTLESCIESLSLLDIDIMLVTHYPVSESIQKKVKYYIYDSNNLLLPSELSSSAWIMNGTFECEMFYKGHNLAILRNISNGINLAESLSYDFFLFLESDNIFSSVDVNRISDLIYLMESNDKKMIFFNNSWINEHSENINTYDTLVFGGLIKYFKEIYNIPTDIDSYKEMFSKDPRKINLNTLEMHFFFRLSEYKDNFLLIKKSCRDYFSSSVMNKYSLSNRCEIVCDTTNKSLILFICNFSESKLTYKINSQSMDLDSGYWFYKGFLDNLKIEIYKADELVDEKQFNLSDFEYEKNLEFGYFKFK